MCITRRWLKMSCRRCLSGFGTIGRSWIFLFLLPPNYLEHRSVRNRYEQEFQSENSEIDEGEEFDSEELESLRKRLRAFVDSLPEKCREIFILACVEGLKYREVAERLDVSVNTVKTQVKSAYAKLRFDFDLKEREYIVILLFFEQLL